VTEPLELAEELPLVAFDGVALLEVVVAQLLVGHALVQDVVGDDQDRVGDGHGGLAWAAATPRHLEPLRVRPERCLPADSLFPGHTPAQEARWAAVGNWPMSGPISATMTSAARRSTPPMVSNSATCSAYGPITCWIRAESVAMVSSR
jgi:hypothetical protein